MTIFAIMRGESVATSADLVTVLIRNDFFRTSGVTLDEIPVYRRINATFRSLSAGKIEFWIDQPRVDPALRPAAGLSAVLPRARLALRTWTVRYGRVLSVLGARYRAVHAQWAERVLQFYLVAIRRRRRRAAAIGLGAGSAGGGDARDGFVRWVADFHLQRGLHGGR